MPQAMQLLRAYVDETGDRGHSGQSSPYFAFAAVLVADEDEARLRAAMSQLRRDLKTPPGKALHWNEHVKTYSRRQHVASVLSAVPGVMVLYVIVEKSAIPAGSGLHMDHAIFYNYAAGLMMERILLAAKDWPGGSRDVVVRFGHVRNFDHTKTTSYFQQKAAAPGWVPWNRLRGAVRFNDQAHWDGLQASDQYAGMLNVALRPDQFGGYEEAHLMRIKQQIRKNGNGRAWGWGFKVLGNEKTFVTAYDSPWRVEPRYADQGAALAAHRPCGTLASWQEAIAAASDHLIVQVGAYAGLASPLLGPLGLDSFTVDISGRSTRGKTITAMVALSCWADPSDKCEAMLTWQAASVIGIEKRLNLVSGLTVVIDETRLVKDPALVDAVVYMIPKNHGRPRGGGWPNMIPWRAVVVSTGEQPATSFTTHQGASARVLSICSPPFGADGQASRAAAEAVQQGVEAAFGTAGPAFVSRLQVKLAEDSGPGKLHARHGELTEMLRGGTDMTGRRAPLAACLAMTAELAADWGIIPFQPPGIADWSAMFAADPQRDNRPQMALDLVREYLAAHADKMCGSNDGSHPPASGWIGHEAREGAALLPEKLREELRHRGYELDAVIPGWLEMGALLTMDTQRPAHLIPRRTAGRLSRHLVFRREILDPQASSADGQ
jgi:Domain of unknown function (DUF927)/Protein of unknown function (DUF3800)